MKTKLLSLLVALVCATHLLAYDCQIDGIRYNLNNTDLTAEVTSGGSYSGSISIPASITYNSQTYSVTTIGGGAFYNCSGLTSVTIPNSVTTIGEDAFYFCYGLTSVTIPNSVTTIGDDAFVGCSGLTSPVYNANCFAYMPPSYQGAYTIPDGIQQIAGSAFRDCLGLTSVTIPNSVTTIGEDAFSDCNNIVYSGTATGSPWGAKCVNGYIEGYLVYSDANKTTLVGCFTAATGSITIPNSVTTIRDNAFYGCSGLTSVTIPNSVTTIGNGAFIGCIGLTSVTIPNSVTTIGDYAFYYCSGLTSVTIPNSVTTIGGDAFYGCTGLTSITCYAITPPTCDSYCFDRVPKSIPVYVPAESIDVYKNAEGWKEFTNILPIENTDLLPLPYEGNSKFLIQNSKLIKNGRLLIEHNGILYNAHGARVE